MDMHDLRYVIRGLLRHRQLTAVTVLTLAIGIGATAAMFGVTYAVLLRPLPYADSGRLVRVWEQRPLDSTDRRIAPATALAWRDEPGVFDTLAYWGAYQDAFDFTLVGPEGSERLRGAYVSGNLFSTLGVAAQHGRALVEDDDAPVRQPVAVIGHRLWLRRFGGDPDAVGRTVTVDNYDRRSYTVVGIMPPWFAYPDSSELWIPAGWSDLDMTQAGVGWLMALGRLADDVTPNAARARLNTRPALQATAAPAVRLAPLYSTLTAEVRPGIVLLLAAAGLALLVACVNVANLRLAHTHARRRELMIRQMLGATPGRMLRLLLVEQAVVALLGAVTGLGLAAAGLPFLLRLAPFGVPRLEEAALGLPVLLATTGLALGCALLIGTTPARWVRRLPLSRDLDDARTSGTGGPGVGRLHDGLLLAQVALTIMLLVGAGLLLRTLHRLESVELGFTSDRLSVTELDLSGSGYSSSARPGPNRPQVFTDQLLARLAALPGVETAGAADRLPPAPASSVRAIGIETADARPSSTRPPAVVRAVTRDYFSAMGIPLLRGRGFRSTDTETNPPVAIINETMAARYFRDLDPVGQRLIDVAGPRFGATAPVVDQIIGVVADVRNGGLEAPVQPEVYKPSYQWAWRQMSLVVRSDLDPGALTPAVRDAVAQLAPDQPVADLRSMRHHLGPSYAQARSRAWLLGGFGGVALALASIGVFGVLDDRVRRRTREIGVRLALGATTGVITRALLGRGLALISGGLVLGVVGAAALARAMRAVLFEVDPIDPFAFGGAVSLVALVAGLSTYGAARRAARVEPAIALRCD